MKTTVMLLLALAAACSRSNQSGNAADSTLPPIDTVKPVVVDTPATAAAPTPGATSPARSQAGTQTGTKTAPRDTTNIGRDRAIPINTKDPKVMIPTVDTTKKRPPA